MHDIMIQGMPGTGSGYGEAISFFALSFYKSGLDVCFDFSPMSHYDKRLKEKLEEEYSDFKNFKFSKNAKICFFIGTPKIPENKNIYNILYFYWETDDLPKGWMKKISHYEEVWVPCKIMKMSLQKNNYRGIIKVFPTPNYNLKKYSKFVIGHKTNPYKKISNEVFKFYYIFQWQYRKGYDCLIKAYYNAFTKNENVMLILKTNKLSGSRDSFILNIKKEINKFKNGRENLPEIYIIPDIIPKSQIMHLHKMCDVYVAPHRGEGWGMPIADAINQKSAVITTKFGGITDYLDDKDAFFIDYVKTPVKNMRWSGPLYSSNQNWAEPDQNSLSDLMKKSYFEKEISSLKAEYAYNSIKTFETTNISKTLFTEFSTNRFKK